MPVTDTARQAHTPAELDRVIGLLRGMGAELVSVGHGRADPSTDTANAFAAAWTLAGGHLAAVVGWPSTAASWLRQATRLTADEPDAWVISDRAQGWAPLAARLAESTGWDPVRTVGFAGLGDERLLELAGTATVEGMHGATATGGIWHVHHGRLIRHMPTRPHPDATALISRPARELAPGAIHVPGFLSLERQQELVRACRRWAQGPVPIRAATLPGGAVMSVRTVCLGWHWQPHRCAAGLRRPVRLRRPIPLGQPRRTEGHRGQRRSGDRPERRAAEHHAARHRSCGLMDAGAAPCSLRSLTDPRRAASPGGARAADR